MNTFKKRIDELGRIVIPKEIRKNYKINNYDELELTSIDDKIIITRSKGISEYKDKLKKYMSLIKKVVNYDMIIFDQNNIVESSFDNLFGEIIIDLKEDFNNLKKTLYINNNEIIGYMYLDRIILDSNLLGYVIFINNEKFIDITILKDIKNIIIELIN